jgi:hypothetical protein
MIPPWAAKLKVTEQSLKRHCMAAFQPSSPATMRATTLSFQVFLYLLLDHSLLDCPKQFKADTFINKWQGAPPLGLSTEVLSFGGS